MAVAEKNMSKVERYGWKELFGPGIKMNIPIQDLRIDRTYQRGEGSRTTLLKLMRGWSWELCGTLLVMQRTTGAYYVVDGQQRLLSAKKRGDIASMPCMVFPSNGPVHEAAVFIECNMTRKRVTAYERWRAAVAANIEPYADLDRTLVRMGFSIAQKSDKRDHINFPDTVIASSTKDHDLCLRVLEMQRNLLANEETMSFAIHAGIFWLCERGVPVGEYLDKIVYAGGKGAIMREYRNMQYAAGVSRHRQGNSAKMCGLAILNIINHKKRNRITVDL